MTGMTQALAQARKALDGARSYISCQRPQAAFSRRAQSEELAKIDAALAAIDAALEGGAVPKVKALEWVDDLPKPARQSVAVTPFCSYEVCDSPGHYPEQPHFRWALHTVPDLRGINTSGTLFRFPRMEAAKAAAQADFERRILSALDLPSPPTGA